MFLTALLSIALVSGPSASAPQAKPAAAKPAADKPAAQTAKPAAGGARVVEVAGGDDMKYSVTTIDAKPGETLRIKLVNKGTLPKLAMAHNIVVLKAGAKQIDFANAAALARATDFIPPDMKDQVLAATTLAGPGETVELTIKLPSAPGSYPFICSFPGHFAAGMRGNIVVK
jgi:azurin